MITDLAILGAGTMGRGIACLFAANGRRVALYDPNAQALQAAAEQMRVNWQLMRTELGDDAVQAGAEMRVTYHDDLASATANAQLVIEAAPEQIDVKRELYRAIQPHLQPDALVASNTSTYELVKLSEGLPFADRMCIMHFFNPAHLVPLVEIVKPAAMAEPLLQSMLELLRSCGKEPIVLKKDVPGFIANRLQAAIVREAFHLLEEGVADARDIDKAVSAGPGMRWAFGGPLETADFGGLDVWRNVTARLFPELSSATRPPALLQQLVEAGRLGVKTGGGIYDYEDGQAEEATRLRDERLLRLLAVKAERPARQ